jgi:hypothetical protein
MSWASYVTTSGDNGKFSTNGLRFATEAEADQYGKDLAGRWFAVIKWESRQTEDPVNSKIEDGVMSRLD